MYRYVRAAILTLAALIFHLLTGVPSAVAGDEVPESLSTAVREAVDAWAAFATTGQIASLDGAYATSGPQHLQFQAESASRSVTPAPEPYRFTVRELRLRSMESDSATVWALVEVGRVGFESDAFGWDFDLVRRDDQWKVWTVVSAERPSLAIESPGVGREPPIVSTTSSQPTPDPPPFPEAAAEVPSIEGQPVSESSSGVRLPALSAWIIVITIVGVALAGYLAPRLDRSADR